MNTTKLLFLGFILSSFLAKAADIKIDGNNNLSGSFTTIQEGIDNASDGDRIILYMQCQEYPEASITIDKSLTFLNSVPEQSFTIGSEVNIEPGNNRKVTFVGGIFDNTVKATGANTTSNATTVSFSDCSLNEQLDFGYDKWTLNLYNNISSHNVIMTAGEIIGNEFDDSKTNIDFYAEPRLKIVQESTASNVAGDQVRIIANFIDNESFSNRNSEDKIDYLIEFNNSNKNFDIRNNLISGYQKLVNIVACDPDVTLNKFLFNTLGYYYNGFSSSCSSSEDYLVILKHVTKFGVTHNNLDRESSTNSCQITPKIGIHNNLSGTDDNTTEKNGILLECQEYINTGGTYGFGYRNGRYEYEEIHKTPNNSEGHAKIIDLDIPSVIYSGEGAVSVKATAIHLK